MRKAIRTLIISALLLLSMQIPASASLQDSLVPHNRDQSSIGEVHLKYNEYPQHHYQLDTYVDTAGDWKPWNWADGAGKQIYIALMEIINAIWQLNVLLANFTMVIVQEAFELDFVSSVVDEVGAAIQNVAGFNSGGFMGNGLWPLLVTFMLCLVGTWAAYVGMVKRESSRAWGGLLSALIVFVFSLGFFSNASKILGGVNDWSSNLQSEILAVSSSIVNPGSSYNKDEGIASIRNQMFDLMVKKPYMLMQYGTTQVDEGRVNDLLAVDPIFNAEDRQKKTEVEVNEKDNAMMSLDGITQRAAFVPLLFIGNTIIGVFLLLISGSIILFQLIFLALALFAPVPLLLALIPRWQQSAVDWVMKLLHAQLMKIAIALLLTILFGISAILYRATETSDLGYLGMMALQIICFVGIWAKRKDLFSMVSTAANNVQSSTGQTLQNYRQKYNQARNKVRQGKNFLESGNGSIRNQPLADRKNKNIGYVNQKQQTEKRNQNQETMQKVRDAAGRMTLTDRNNEELREGQEHTKQLHHRANVENAPTTEKDQLMKRNRQMDPAKTKETGTQKDNVTHIDDLRSRRLEKGQVANAPLADRKSLKQAQQETATAIERPDTQDVEHSDSQQSERKVNLRNQQDHQDNINEKQKNQLSERRTLENNTERNVSSDMVNRNVVNNESKERNIQETVSRNNVSNENNDRTVNNVTERSNSVNENYKNVHESVSEKDSLVHNVTRRNEQNVNINKEQVNVSRIVENAKKNDKPITKWEAEQQIKAKRNKK